MPSTFDSVLAKYYAREMIAIQPGQVWVQRAVLLSSDIELYLVVLGKKHDVWLADRGEDYWNVAWWKSSEKRMMFDSFERAEFAINWECVL